MKMDMLQQRRDELERKEQKLKESLLRFDKFLKVPLSRNHTNRKGQCNICILKEHAAPILIICLQV